jgi:hypothetical protein
MTIIVLLILHIVQIVLLFNLPPYFILPKLTDNANGIVKTLVPMAYFGILTLILYKLINKERVLSIEVSELEIKNGKRILIIYFFVDIVLLILFSIFHEIQIGRLHL